MTARTAALAAAAGLASFLLVFAVVAEALATVVGFSVFVAAPAGLLVGVAVAALTYLSAADEDPTARRRARALSGFGVVFLAVLVVGAALGQPLSLVVLVAAVLGVVAGVASVAFVPDARQST